MYDSQPPHLNPLHIRTAYSDLLGRFQDLQVSHATATLKSCSLIVKRVGPDQYIYAQGRLTDGTIRQVYIAPADEAGRALMERFGKANAEVAGENSAVETTAKALNAAGMMRLDTVEWRVVNALAEGGIFRVGGVLVGTIAYRCMANLLGVRLCSAAAVAADVDIGIKTIQVAVIPEVVCPQSALDRLEMVFSPENAAAGNNRNKKVNFSHPSRLLLAGMRLDLSPACEATV